LLGDPVPVDELDADVEDAVADDQEVPAECGPLLDEELASAAGALVVGAPVLVAHPETTKDKRRAPATQARTPARRHAA
jgi:hypothetical protein